MKNFYINRWTDVVGMNSPTVMFTPEWIRFNTTVTAVYEALKFIGV